MSVTQPLLEDEVWSRETCEITWDVANSLGPPDGPSHTLLMLVNEIATEMLSSRFSDFFPITEHTAPGAAYHVTMSFLADKFRLDLATAAKERLGRHENSSVWISEEIVA